MKKLKNQSIVLVLLLTVLFGASSEAKAQSFGLNLSGFADSAKGIFKGAADSAKKAIEEANRKKAEEEQRRIEASRPQSTLSSLIEIQGQTAPDAKWLMFVVSKGSFEEKYTIAVSGGAYKHKLVLRDGPGIYDVKIFQNPLVERYVSYTFLASTQVENKDERDMSFLLPSEMVQSHSSEIIALAKEITRNATSKEEIVVAINDYVAKNVQYDFPSYYDGSYANRPFDALTVLKRPMAVCAGYSNFFAALARAAGIKTKVINGKGVINGGLENHAWNEVLLDGEWKSLDVTWNSTLKTNKYLFTSEETFRLDHLKEEEMVAY